ncbi:hypothetical protein [Mucilaginibacter arboris]|uniref:Prevent-host-death family protein n=1 Tax=Mucilaginibacter arboris TaxID=2682090 RepID=A0A7K1T152_9SPHI|nr:hypothetical protein [Mucilaginibacter arboris]MVN23296.1 hypothetical protein [Mucilaginibacter arboris]
MLTINPQYLKDENGERSLVVLSAKEFDAIMEELEDLEDIRLYDEAKKNDTGERIPMEEAFKLIEAERKANG